MLELVGAGQDVGAMTFSRGAIVELFSGAFTGNAVSSGVTTKALTGGTQSGGAVPSGGVLDIFSRRPRQRRDREPRRPLWSSSPAARASPRVSRAGAPKSSLPAASSPASRSAPMGPR